MVRQSSLAADVMTASPIGSPMLKARAPLVLERPEDAWFDVRLLDCREGVELLVPLRSEARSGERTIAQARISKLGPLPPRVALV